MYEIDRTTEGQHELRAGEEEVSLVDYRGLFAAEIPDPGFGIRRIPVERFDFDVAGHGDSIYWKCVRDWGKGTCSFP